MKEHLLAMNKKDLYTKTFLKLFDDKHEEDIDLYKSKWWFNLRTKPVGGLRLTDEGYEHLTDHDVKTYTIDLPKELKISPQILLWLDNFINTPYYISKHKIYVFTEAVAFELYLFSGDVKKFGYAKAMNKHLAQKNN